MIKLKVKADPYEFLVKGEKDNLSFILDGKVVGQGKIGNDGRSICTKGVDMIYTSRIRAQNDNEIRGIVKEMVRSLSLAIKEEREWFEGKPISVEIDKVWIKDGEMIISANNKEMSEIELIGYLRSFLPKDLFQDEPTQDSDVIDQEEDFEEEEIPDWARDEEPQKEPEGGRIATAPTGLLDALKNKG